MTKKFFILFNLILISFTVTACQPAGNLPVSKQSNIKIGLILPLSGDSAQLGAGARNAAEMAWNEIKQAQNLKNNYELIFEDDQMNSKHTITAFQKLININQMKSVVSFASNTGNVLTPLAEQKQIIHFGVASDPNVAEGNYNFIHWTQPRQEAAKIVEKFKKASISTVAMVYQSQAGVIATVNEIEKNASEEISFYKAELNANEMDFRSTLLKLAKNNPDIYYMAFDSPQIEAIGKQFKELDINKPITTVETFESSTQPELFNGHWYVSAAESTDQFRNSYQAKFNQTPTIGAANVYDIVKILIWAYENVDDSTNNELVAQKIKTLKDWPGALGNLNITEQGIIVSEAALKKVVNGEFVVMEE